MKFKKLVFLFFLLLMAVVFGKTLRENELGDLDIMRINRRRAYYPRYLGRFYQNKVGERFSLSRKKMFSYLGWWLR